MYILITCCIASNFWWGFQIHIFVVQFESGNLPHDNLNCCVYHGSAVYTMGGLSDWGHEIINHGNEFCRAKITGESEEEVN